ncbi:peptidoglycan recognition protein family protein [Microtetraspora malaysiensis]|uniref:peptidoglycan recognition protein family protein n=1 Tax=Microtetraspora malaysiensis TaxID=161358 RepID=UPI003D90A7FE
MKHVQAVKHGGRQAQVTRIVIHATVSPCVRGGAQAVARYFQSRGAGGSAHYVVDPGEVVRCVTEDVVAYHAPPNTGTIGVELCDPQKGPASRWKDDDHEAMLVRAARLVRQIAARWDVPLRRLSVAEVRAGKRGICGHVDVSKAFGQTDHTDPGDGFPWNRFMELVLDEEPTSAPDSVQEDDGHPVWPGRLLKYAKGQPMMSGRDVRVWQAALAKAGFATDVDGWFGPSTAERTRAFQRRSGLAIDGVVGPKTWAAGVR